MKWGHGQLSHVAQPLGSLVCTRVPKGQASVNRQEFDIRQLKGETLSEQYNEHKTSGFQEDQAAEPWSKYYSLNTDTHRL